MWYVLKTRSTGIPIYDVQQSRRQNDGNTEHLFHHTATYKNLSSFWIKMNSLKLDFIQAFKTPNVYETWEKVRNFHFKMTLLTFTTFTVQNICGLGKSWLCICFQHFDLDSATLPVELMSIATICNEMKPPWKHCSFKWNLEHVCLPLSH